MDKENNHSTVWWILYTIKAHRFAENMKEECSHLLPWWCPTESNPAEVGPWHELSSSQATFLQPWSMEPANQAHLRKPMNLRTLTGYRSKQSLRQGLRAELWSLRAGTPKRRWIRSSGVILEKGVTGCCQEWPSMLLTTCTMSTSECQEQECKRKEWLILSAEVGENFRVESRMLVLKHQYKFAIENSLIR